MKWLKRIIWLLGIPPLAFAITILTFYFHVAIQDGHLPTYNNPDPKYTGLYVYYATIIETSLTLWFYTFLVWLVIIIVYLFKNKDNYTNKPVVATIIFQVMAILVCMSEVLEWFVD